MWCGIAHQTPLLPNKRVAANSAQVYFGRQTGRQERGIRLRRSIRGRFWEILTICGFRLERRRRRGMDVTATVICRKTD